MKPLPIKKVQPRFLKLHLRRLVKNGEKMSPQTPTVLNTICEALRLLGILDGWFVDKRPKSPDSKIAASQDGREIEAPEEQTNELDDLYNAVTSAKTDPQIPQ